MYFFKLKNFIKNNIDKMDWEILSRNPNAIYLLEKNFNKINWLGLCENPNAIYLLDKNLDKISLIWIYKNANAKHLLEKNKDKINWGNLSSNPSIFELDYDALFKEKLIQIAIDP